MQLCTINIHGLNGRLGAVGVALLLSGGSSDRFHPGIPIRVVR